MANDYITLDGFQYPVSFTRYQPTEEKAQTIVATVGGSHVSQHFNFVEYRWGFDLRVPYTGDATWGNVADLKASYRKEYVSFTDHYGSTYDVFMEGQIGDIPDSPRIDGVARATVFVALRRKQ
jgi:hypothetical protein